LKSRTWLGQTNLADKFWGIWPNYQQPFWYSTDLVHVFQSSTIPNVYLGLGFEFEFGPQMIKDLAF
jgi:hypothetical protein